MKKGKSEKVAAHDAFLREVEKLMPVARGTVSLEALMAEAGAKIITLKLTQKAK